MRRALTDVEGVLSAGVSLEGKRAEVRCGLNFNEPELLVKAIEQAGFQAKLSGPGSLSEPLSE